MIYTIKRNGVVIFQHEIRGTRTQSAPAVDFVDIEFDYYEAILLERNDTIEFDGQIYYCDRQYANYQKKSNNLYNHKARFLSDNYKATDIALLDPQGLPIFEIEGDLLTLLTLAVDNLNRGSSGGWTYLTPPNTVTKLFQIENENVMSFLTKCSGEFQLPLVIKDRVVSFQNSIAHPDAGEFEYGKGKGFLDLKKSYKSGEKAPNVVYGSGGNGLILQSPLIDVNDIIKNGRIEGFYQNENIKPTTRVQMQGTVSAENVVTTTELNYDLNTYKIAGQLPWINFETGALAGTSFFITSSTYDNISGVTVLYLKKRTVDGVLLPSTSVRPLAGDYFNITNITQPQEVVDEAILQLEQETQQFLEEGIFKNLVLEANLDPLFPENIKLNDRIKIVDTDLDIDGFFIINDIKEDLQNLNKKDITLDYIGRSLFSFGLPVKNDNLIEVAIQTNYDDLVVIEEEIVVIYETIEVALEDISVLEEDMNDLQSVKLPQLTNRLTATEIDLDNIHTVELPLKEDLSNKVDILEIEVPTTTQYPNALSVKDALNLKQDKLTAGANIAIDPITNTISSTSSSQTYVPITSSGENVVIYSNNTIVNISNFTSTTISDGNNTGDLLTIASGNSPNKDVFFNYIDKSGNSLTVLGVTDGETFKFVWDGKWVDIT